MEIQQDLSGESGVDRIELADQKEPEEHDGSSDSPKHENQCSWRPVMWRALPFVAMSIVAILIGYILIDFPVNGSFLFLFTRPVEFTIANLFAIGLAYAAVYLIGQRTHAAVAVFLVACFLIGIADYYVMEFRGQPIAPADLLALSTAAEVAGGYSLVPDFYVIVDALLLGASLVGLHFCPKARRSRVSIATGCTGGIVAILAFAFLLGTFDIEDDLGCNVDSWIPINSYRSNGTVLCFLKRVQDLAPTAPEGYSEEAVASLLVPYLDDEGESDDFLTVSQDVSEDEDAIEDDGSETVRPNVIVIMNESFCDLSYISGLEGTEAYPAALYELSEESVYSGTAYSSVVGGGTCDSEFEFLTSSTMAEFEGGIHPYTIYDLSNADSLVSYFQDLGYGTYALHPNKAGNWNRDRVYSYFGFDEFDDITTFSDAEYFRYYITDGETYDRVLEVIEESDDPQFIFDVTMQNHGGYETGLVEEEDSVSITLPDGMEDAELNEFVAGIQQSDADLAEFIDALRELDEPVVVCFFGDHQPNFSNSSIFDFENDSIADIQQRYTVPYLIWANYDTGLETGTVEDTSLNYLASMLIETTGLPSTPLLSFVSDLRAVLPVVNSKGYLDADGVWHALKEAEEDAGEPGAAGDAATAFQNLLIVEYANLFEESWWR